MYLTVNEYTWDDLDSITLLRLHKLTNASVGESSAMAEQLEEMPIGIRIFLLRSQYKIIGWCTVEHVVSHTKRYYAKHVVDHALRYYDVHVFVDSLHRNQGHATLLMKRVHRLLQNKKRKIIWPEFYERQLENERRKRLRTDRTGTQDVSIRNYASTYSI